MNPPAKPPYDSPALALMREFQRWIALGTSSDFWRYLAEEGLSIEELRRHAKEIIVWLELKNQGEPAAQLDDAMSGFRNAVLEFVDRTQHFHPPDDYHCHDLLDEMIRRASIVAGACEDIDTEVAEDVWEGFPGE